MEHVQQPSATGVLAGGGPIGPSSRLTSSMCRPRPSSRSFGGAIGVAISAEPSQPGSPADVRRPVDVFDLRACLRGTRPDSDSYSTAGSAFLELVSLLVPEICGPSQMSHQVLLTWTDLRRDGQLPSVELNQIWKRVERRAQAHHPIRGIDGEEEAVEERVEISAKEDAAGDIMLRRVAVAVQMGRFDGLRGLQSGYETAVPESLAQYLPELSLTDANLTQPGAMASR